jgi:hypothetical protein
VSQIAPAGELRQREPRIRDKAHLAFVAKLFCVGCYCRGGFKTWPVHVAHVRIGFVGEPGWREVGKAEKPSDARTAPLCRICHLDGPRAQHRVGEEWFWRDLNVYPPAFCRALVEARVRGRKGNDVIRAASQGAFPWPSPR